MFMKTIQMLEDEVSGDGALGYVREISRHHRMQASPGYRRAAEYVRDELARAGVQTKVFSYPANSRTRYWGSRMFQEWDAQDGALYLVTGDGPDRKLADYREDKLSLIQRSSPGSYNAELVAVGGGTEDADYEGLDVAGKMVLADGAAARVAEMAVRRRGAIGVLYDGMRKMAPVGERIDYPDAHQYTSFWARREAEPPVGHVLTPRQGDELRAMIKQRVREGKPPLRVRGTIQSCRYDGSLEVVSAFIPGETPQEVVLEAHLCHPQPSANDNASGSAALMEVARALHRLTHSRRLVPPRRGIRFLWVPEMTGTFAYLATNESTIPNMVAGLNLDMVGEDQDKCRSVFTLIRPPMSMASFVPAVLEWVQDQYLTGSQTRYARDHWPTLRCAAVPFSAGSDHYIMSDPTVGVPSPMLGQHPDRYWHTSLDTLDKVDPKMLGFAANLAAAYACWIARAGPDEARWLADEMTARFKREMVGLVQRRLTGLLAVEPEHGPSLQAQVGFLTECQEAALNTLERLGEVDPGPWQIECARFAATELARARLRLGGQLPERTSPAGEWETKAASMVPERLFRGPISPEDLELSPADMDELESLRAGWGSAEYHASVLAMYWTDGRRSLQEICDLVELEAGARPTEFLVKYYQILARAGGLQM